MITASVNSADRSLRLMLGVCLLLAAAAIALAGFVSTTSAIGLIGIATAGAGMYLIARIPAYVVICLAVWMPFETFVASHLPTPWLGAAVQAASELAIYLTCAAVMIRRWLDGHCLHRTPLDLPLLALCVVITLSVLVNQPPLVGSVMNVRTTLRYAALFYLVVNLDWSPEQTRMLMRAILLAAAVQLVVAGAQLVGGTFVKQLTLPGSIDFQIARQSRQFHLLTRGREIGSVFGLLCDTVYFGLFMLVVLAIVLGRLRRLRWWHALPVVLVLLAIGYSYSRAATIAAALMLVFWLAMRGGTRPLLAGMAIVAAILLTFILTVQVSHRGFRHPNRQQLSITENLSGVFTRDYLERASRQRLGSLLGTAPTALHAAPMLGFGPDEHTTIESINRAQPNYLRKTLTKRGFEDVYWVAILAYLGLAGIAAMTWLLARMIWSNLALLRVNTDPTLQWVAGAALLVACITPLLMLFMRVLEFRVFSFYLWLLCGMALAAQRGLTATSENRP